MPYAVGYTRFSSIKQRKGSSLDRQQELIAEWFKENPDYIPYPRSFNDLGKSGFTGAHLKEHGALGQLIAAINGGLINKGDVILVESVDRLGRLSELVMLNLITEILKCGIKIIILDDQKEYVYETTGSEIQILIGQITQAHKYSTQLSSRIAKSYKNRESQARLGVPIKRRTPIWLNSDGTLIENIAKAMKSAFEDSAAGMGERRILRRLFQREPIFKKYNPSTVTRWLTNETAIGYWRGTKIYPPIVSEELFYQVQKSIKARHRPGNAPTKHSISGLVKCGHCGANYQVKINKNSPNQMVCSGYQKAKPDGGCTNGKHLPLHVLQHIINDTCTSAVQQGIRKNQLSQAEKEKIKIEIEIEKATREIVSITGISEFATIPECREKLSELANTRAKLKNKLNLIELQNPIDPSQSPYEDAWDEQYLMLEKDPMLLNSKLQEINYYISCFNDGRIQSTTTGNELSSCRYVKYQRSTETYLLETSYGDLRIAHPKNQLNATKTLAAKLDRIRADGCEVQTQQKENHAPNQFSKNTENLAPYINIGTPMKASDTPCGHTLQHRSEG
ncbi:recombinase family protein [Pseudomonas sp. PA27(2017)]|uniref:recombinase family protein n=1 Tax=Pseudomonas sp. PA27(2017) TaxID=1932112 RepID=UPI0009624F52|nr:recombinase family protein [Pseudomonas sp. PA27(2017)]OLU35337.1 hypothetical protein BVH06_02985 [Pseudomonas sp. PA27(2017)]